MKKLMLTPLLFALSIHLSSSVANAVSMKDLPPAKCEADYPNFQAWLADVKTEALENGVSLRTWNAAESQMQVDPAIIRKDQGQGYFYKSFLKYAERTNGSDPIGRRKLSQNQQLLNNIEAQYGVPGEILMALWGMENAYQDRVAARYSSNPIVTSMTTLAYDCRRAAIFRYNLMAALKLVDEGHVTLSELTGQWAGEMSSLQFKPANYYIYGVDFNNNGKIRVVDEKADMFATAANMLKDKGWKAGQPYILEVSVPTNNDRFPWEKADLTLDTKLPMSEWARLGVKSANGTPLRISTDLQASLMLPMGRFGPTFLAFENFATLLEWNASLNNALSIAYLASRIDGAPAMNVGQGSSIDVLTKEEYMKIQEAGVCEGYDMGKIDGYLGTRTRAFTRDMQLRLGLPADSYPTREFMGIYSETTSCM